jgi:hypothetical protein
VVSPDRKRRQRLPSSEDPRRRAAGKAIPSAGTGGDSSYRARAVVTAGEERDRLYRMVSDGTSAYEQNTDRVFPVIILEGVPAPA